MSSEEKQAKPLLLSFNERVNIVFVFWTIGQKKFSGAQKTEFIVLLLPLLTSPVLLADAVRCETAA